MVVWRYRHAYALNPLHCMVLTNGSPVFSRSLLQWDGSRITEAVKIRQHPHLADMWASSDHSENH